MSLKSVCVFCGANAGTDPAYTEAAVALGRAMAERKLTLVYGGGAVGLMGLVADAALEAGGEVVGVIPEHLVNWEVAHKGLTRLEVVGSMHERKALMADLGDAFVALPGGIGTFEEFFEVWTWRQLGYHDKPVGLLNVAGYYDGLMQFLHSTVEQQFMGTWQMDLIRMDTDLQRLLPGLVQDAGLAPAAQLEAI